MSSHPEIQKRLAEYSGGDLEPAERNRVAEHLASCPDCRAELADMETVLRLLRTTPEIEPPPWLATRVMAQVREQQAGRKNWLQRLFLPLHIKLPLEAVAVLFVCVTGYYLSRTVETGLKAPVTWPDTFEQAPAVQSPSAPRTTEPQTDAAPRKKAPPPVDHSRDMQPPPASAPLQPPAAAPALQGVPDRSFAPPPAFREDRAAPATSGRGEALKSLAAPESFNRAQETAPERRAKRIRRPDSRDETPASAAPAAADRASGIPAGVTIPGIMIRLTPDNPATAAITVREAVIRSGGTIIEEPDLPARQLKLRIAAGRIQEFQNQLEGLGRLTKRPLAQHGSQLLEVTVQW